MKLLVISDLHTEFTPFDIPDLDRDILVLAGDIAEGSKAKAILEKEVKKSPIIYILGNHEYYFNDFDVIKDFWSNYDVANVHFLENKTCYINDIRFIGATLWTDFDALSDRPDSMPGAMTHNLRMREKAFRAANFYLSKTGTTRYGLPFDAQAVREQALVCQQWLREKLSSPFEGKTLVITHFAPSLKSHDPRYGVNPGTVGFCNALEDLLGQADVWLHGHLHCASNYQVGKCRVMANPLGYYRKREQSDFLPQYLVTI